MTTCRAFCWVAAAAIALALGAASAASAATPLLPDLEELPPGNIGVQAVAEGGGVAFHLGFDSGAQNIGAGLLEIEAHQTGPPGTDMTANQVIHYSDTGTSTRPVGVLHYDTDPSHNHWHYEGFERYELHRLADDSLVAPDNKVGFCLADVYQVPAFTTTRTFSDWCGLGNPAAASIDEGISVGWGDKYAAQVDGQFIDITGVPAGYYELVNRANPDGKVLESDSGNDSNDAGTALVSIQWPQGMGSMPSVAEVRACPHSTTCAGNAAPVAVTGSATGVTASSSTLGGTLDASGLPTAIHWEYGPTSSYGTSTAPATVDPASLGAPVASGVNGLSAGTVYHYRMVATNSSGSSYGADEVFTTAAAAAAAGPPVATARIISATARPGGPIVLRVATPSAGRLLATTRFLRISLRAQRAVHGAGVWQLTVNPGRRLRSMITRSGHLRLTLTVTFTPLASGPVRLLARVMLKRRRVHHSLFAAPLL